MWCGAYRTLRANITSLNFTSITVFDSIDRLDEYEYEYEYDGHECEFEFEYAYGREYRSEHVQYRTVHVLYITSLSYGTRTPVESAH